MNKSIFWILLIFLIPLGIYYGLTRDKITVPPSIAAGHVEVIKFSSPMCYECQELEKIFDEVFPKYNKNIILNKIDVTKRDKNVQDLIKKYNVTLVPTTVFKKADGTVTRRIEGCMQEQILDNYLKELIDG